MTNTASMPSSSRHRHGKHRQLRPRSGRVLLSLLAALISFTVMQPLHAQKPSKNARATQASDEDPRVQANIDTVMAFYKASANADFEQARQYVGYYYIEHDPAREDGIEGLQKALNPSRIGARRTFTIERLVGDLEYVILHAKLTPTMGGPSPAAAGAARPPAAPTAAAPGGGLPPSSPGTEPPPELRPTEAAEIFRLFDGKIVEHWKVIQQS